MSFETAIYTDVTAQEAVDGVDGFNFQSISAELDGMDKHLIREQLLHQISTHWPIERDEQEHPPTAAFIKREERFYFSRGRSTGTTANGRRGNQLTQAIVAHDVSGLELYRPAQIFASAKWRLEKSPSASSTPWSAPFDISPAFESAALIEWSQADPWVQEVLPAYLTMLEEVSGEKPRKVVLVHHDLEVVLRWFALGTLLLDSDVANSLEFRAFVADPYQTNAQLVGMHPDLNAAHISGAHIVNLIDCNVTDVAVSDSARLICDWLARLETFDAIDVIDIARRWMPYIGTKLGAAGAEMVTGTREAQLGREEWDLGVAIIRGLASNGLSDDLELYLDELSASVSSYQLKTEDDFIRSAQATRFAAKTDIQGLAEALLAPSLESLAASPEFSATWVNEITATSDWIWPRFEDTESLANNLTDIIQAAPEPALSGLLQLVKPLSEILPSHTLRPAVIRAVEYTRVATAMAPTINLWDDSAFARNYLRESLVGDLTDRSSPRHSRVLSELCVGTWDFLDITNPGQMLTADERIFLSWLNASRIARVDINQRPEIIESMPVRPASDTWSLGLESMVLPENGELLISWIQHIGTQQDLEYRVLTDLSAVLKSDPKSLNLKDTQRWIPIIEASIKASQDNELLVIKHAELEQIISDIPTMKTRLTGLANAVKGSVQARFNNEKKDS